MSGYLENLFNGDDENNTPLTAAIGFNDGANKGFWRVQPRQKLGKERGRWIEMGAEVRAYFKDLRGNLASAVGRAIGSDGTPDGVRVLFQGQDSKGAKDGIYGFKTSDVRVAEAYISDEYLESKGIDDSTVPSDIDVNALTSIADIERADITPDDIRMANDGINSPEGKQLSAYKESDEGKAIAQLEDADAADVAQGAKDMQEAFGEDMPEFGPDGWRMAVTKAKGEKALQQVREDMAMEALRDKLSDKEELKPDIDADQRAKDFGYAPVTPSPEDIADDRSEYRYPENEDNPGSARFGVERMPDGSYEATAYTTGEIFYGANKNEALNQVLDRYDPEVDARNKARDEAQKKIDDAEFARDNDTPRMSRDDFGKRVDDMVSGYYDDLTGNKLPGTPDVPTKEQIDRAYDNYSRDYNNQKSDESVVDSDSNDFFVGDALEGLREETDTVGSFEREMADELVRNAMEGKDTPDADTIIESLGAAKKGKKKKEPTEEDLVDEDFIDPLDELIEPDRDTSEFDLPVIEKGLVPEDSVEVDDFVNSPDTDDLLKITNVEPEENGDNVFTGIDRDGVEQSFTTRPGQELKRTIHGEPGDTDITEQPAVPAKKAPAKKAPVSEDFVPKNVTVPKNAKPATYADVEVGDATWTKDGVEIGTIRKILEKGIDNFGRDFTRAEVVDSSGKVATARFLEGQKYSKVPKSEKPVAPEKPADPTKPAPIPEPVIVPTPVTPKKPSFPEVSKADQAAAVKSVADSSPEASAHDIAGEAFNNLGGFANATGDKERVLELFAGGIDKGNIPGQNVFERDQLREIIAAFGGDSDSAGKAFRLYSGLHKEAQKYESNLEAPEAPADITPAIPEAPEAPEVERRGDHGRDILPTTKSVEDMRATKIKKKAGAQDPDAILSQLTEDYPDGFFVDDPEDALDGGFMTHRQTIDGGKTRMEIVVTRTNGNQFEVNTRFTDLATGEEKTFVHYKPRDSYTGIHGIDNGVEILSEYFSGRKSPVAPGSAQARSFFAPGNTWNNRMGYWRDKYNKSGRTEDDLTDAQLETLEDKFDGDIDAMNEADTINATRMRTLEESFQHAANGQNEVLNLTTAEYLGNKMKSEVASFYKALRDGDVEAARVRFQAMMNRLADNEMAGKIFLKVIRKGLKDQLDRAGIQGQERTRALQSLSATVTNYVRHANKSWTLDNTVKLPHVSGGGLTVVKKGDKVEFTDNQNRKVVGRVVGLRANSGPNGNNDFARLQFLGEDGKLHTSDADLAATHMKLVDPNTPLTSYDGWDRLGDLTFSRLGQEATDRRKAARLKKAMSWKDPSDPNYNPNKVDLTYVGSDGVREGEDPSDGEGGNGKAATELLPGDEIFSPSGEVLGTVVKTKITTVKGEPVVAVQYRDADGNLQKIAYGPDDEVGPSSPKD